MMKKLKQEENKDKQHPERKADNKEEVLSANSFCTSLAPKFPVKIEINYPVSADGKAVDMPHSFFHPPGA